MEGTHDHLRGKGKILLSLESNSPSPGTLSFPSLGCKPKQTEGRPRPGPLRTHGAAAAGTCPGGLEYQPRLLGWGGKGLLHGRGPNLPLTVGGWCLPLCSLRAQCRSRPGRPQQPVSQLSQMLLLLVVLRLEQDWNWGPLLRTLSFLVGATKKHQEAQKKRNQVAGADPETSPTRAQRHGPFPTQGHGGQG